ncbi:ABC transporter permease subunit [uncultured Ruminococcus sp.]|uniref:ABC transporter permease subunit n=1 Tax=uncultured Ruminococcus sp. TaxID=165186 RepID=UPI0025F9984D|nr:ABC transporter permease subunit [uncultured Ruminococcus sp.]
MSFADSGRYIKNPMTQFCLFLSVVLGIYAGYTSVQAQPGTNTLYYLVGDAYFLIILLADIILTALAIGREFSDHTIRNKIIIGYTKSQVFLSELLTILVITIITYLLMILPFGIMTANFWMKLPVMGVVRIVILLLLVYLAMISLTTAICFVSCNRTASAIIAILLAFGLYLTDYEIRYVLNQPEILHYETRQYDDDGNETYQKRDEPNPQYVSGTKRAVLSVINYCNPVAAIDNCVRFTFYANDMLAEETALQMQENDYPEMNRYFCSLCGVILIVPLVGLMIFRRKDLK